MRGYTDTYNEHGSFFFIGRQGAKCGNVHYHVGKAYMTEHAVVGKPTEDNDAIYLAYKLSLLDLGKLQSQSAQPGLAVSTLADVELEVPSETEQKSIGVFLSSIDQKISLNTRINAELEAMAKQLYDYWFVQFDFPDENGKPYKSSGGKMVYNEKLKREIPEGWEVKNIFEVADVLYGYPFSTNLFVEQPTEKPVVRIRDIIENSTSAYTTEDIDDEYRLNEGDLVIGMDGNFHMNYWHNNKCYLNQRCVRLRNIPNVPLSNIQLYYNIKPVLDHKQELIQGSTVGHLLDSDIREFWILCPSVDRQKEIKELFDSLLLMCTKNKNELLYLTHLRDSLLPMLMNGQVTIE